MAEARELRQTLRRIQSIKTWQLVILLIIAIVVAVVWWWNYRKYVSTIDANLDGSRVNVSVRAMAPLSAVFKQEGDALKPVQIKADIGKLAKEIQRKQR